jgi:hypothetical protein
MLIDELDLCGAGFSLRGLVLATPKPRRLKPAPQKAKIQEGARIHGR